jgi:glutaminyl-tRNA synthetase
VTSKRRLLQLVDGGFVSGWDEPRMPTLRGLRRRGYTPEAIRRFWEEAGIAKRENNIEFAKLESILRDDLNRRALRRMAVLDPLKVIITNWPEGHVEPCTAQNNPEDDSAGVREVLLGREIYIERDDFMEDPPKKYFRLSPGAEVRLRFGYFITCQEVVKDETGAVIELRCTYDPATAGGNSPDGRKVRGTIHWVSAEHATDAEVRMYDHLFEVEDPTEPPAGSDNWLDNVSRDSLRVVEGAKLEPALGEAQPGVPYQFERVGYFCLDPDSTAERLVFNRTVSLRDTWAKISRDKAGAATK